MSVTPTATLMPSAGRCRVREVYFEVLVRGWPEPYWRGRLRSKALLKTWEAADRYPDGHVQVYRCVYIRLPFGWSLQRSTRLTDWGARPA